MGHEDLTRESTESDVFPASPRYPQRRNAAVRPAGVRRLWSRAARRIAAAGTRCHVPSLQTIKPPDAPAGNTRTGKGLAPEPPGGSVACSG